ncbi:MAG: peptide ABC transporter substrate-binding protein [Acidihalobacter sp.]|uniref:peptide ABC transporter substrate-binding protein n=1 Tax=Acidihalobacter sp. TaxID=1872108 RepID=UPI00307E67B6
MRVKRILLSATSGLLLLFCAISHALAAQTPQHGGTIVTVPGVGLGPPAAINGFNYLLTSSEYDFQAENIMYQPLLWIDGHQQVDWKQSIASGIKIGPDHRTYTITLSKKWHWSDGKPVTAQDVAYTYRMIVKLGSKFPNYGTGGIPTDVATVKVLGPYRLEIVTKQPVNADWFELNGISLLTPLPAHAWSAYSVKQLYDKLTNVGFFKVVDGPFKLQTFETGRYASFVPNPRYSGNTKPYIDKLVIRFLSTPQAVFSALRTGEIQIGNLPYQLYPARRQLASLHTTITAPSWGFGYVGFNFSNPSIAYLRDARVRQAIMHALDQKLMIKVLYYGHGAPDFGPVPPVPATFLSPAAKQLRQQGAYDPALSKKLLKEAGWKPGPDGYLVKNGHRLSFTTYVPPGSTREPTLIKAMLAKVGIDMHISEKPFNQIIAQTSDPANHTWQSIYLAWTLSSYPSGETIWNCGGAFNAYHYCNKKMDRLITASTSHSGLDPLYRYQDYFTQQQPVVVLPAYDHIIKSSPLIHGVRKAFPPSGLMAPQYLWIAKNSH